MNDDELRELARNQVETLELLQVRADLPPDEGRRAQADLEATRDYWRRLAYPERYQQPAWWVKHWRCLMGREAQP